MLTSLTPLINTQNPQDGIQISLSDQKGNHGKLKLAMRTLEFEREIAAAHLPSDVHSLLQLAIAQRQQNFENKYLLVGIWIKLKETKGSWWRQVGCSSNDEVLARLDLPGGETLARWEILVRMFDRETFLLAGDEVLGYLIHEVMQNQDTPNRQRQDYEAIFRQYCAEYVAFDKHTFYSTVNAHINRKYKKIESVKRQLPESKPGVISQWCVAPNKSNVSPGSSVVEFRMRDKFCPKCLEHLEALAVARTYIKELRSIIKEDRGATKVPPLPGPLEHAFRSLKKAAP